MLVSEVSFKIFHALLFYYDSYVQTFQLLFCSYPTTETNFKLGLISKNSLDLFSLLFEHTSENVFPCTKVINAKTFMCFNFKLTNNLFRKLGIDKFWIQTSEIKASF